MGVEFCGEYILRIDTPERYCFSSAYSSHGNRLDGVKPEYDKVQLSRKYGAGDVIGCGIDWVNERYFFSLNGDKHGKFFYPI